jgi:hypothetical protein
MRLSREDKQAKIIELYKAGWSYRQLQKRYHLSPRDIARLVNGIEVKCSACGKPKGKVRFHAHHPDRLNRPDYTIPLCPSCHAKEEARLRREKEEKSQAPLSEASLTTENTVGKLSATSFSFPPGPLSPTGKKVAIGIGSVIATETFFPGSFDKLWQKIQDHWQHYDKSDRRPIMGLKRPH